jgi:hypothetical protein
MSDALDLDINRYFARLTEPVTHWRGNPVRVASAAECGVLLDAHEHADAVRYRDKPWRNGCPGCRVRCEHCAFQTTSMIYEHDVVTPLALAYFDRDRSAEPFGREQSEALRKIWEAAVAHEEMLLATDRRFVSERELIDARFIRMMAYADYEDNYTRWYKSTVRPDADSIRPQQPFAVRQRAARKMRQRQNSLIYNAEGVPLVWTGRYQRIDGKRVKEYSRVRVP